MSDWQKVATSKHEGYIQLTVPGGGPPRVAKQLAFARPGELVAPVDLQQLPPCSAAEIAEDADVCRTFFLLESFFQGDAVGPKV